METHRGPNLSPGAEAVNDCLSNNISPKVRGEIASHKSAGVELEVALVPFLPPLRLC